MKGEPRKSKGRTPSAHSKTEIQKVMRLEREVWKAAREKNAGNFRKLVPADALMIFQSGIWTQPEYIATMRGRTLEENTIEDLRGHMPNANTVILTYETVRAGNFEGKPFPSTRVIESTTWIRRAKRWVAILNQETPLENVARPGAARVDPATQLRGQVR
jgi:hypothetical protein